MSKIDNVLKYVQLYTDANDHAIKRIRVILENEFPEKKNAVEIIEKTKIVFVKSKQKNPEISIQEFAKQIQDQHGIEIEKIKNKNRQSEIVKQRNKFVFFAIESGFSIAEIGRFLNKNHSTIIHSFKNQKQ